MAINIKKGSIIYPYFVVGGRNRKEAIPSFPGQHRLSADLLLKDIAGLKALGVNKVLLFGVPDTKDEAGSMARAGDNIISVAAAKIKKEFRQIMVFTDVCLCMYTSHGHCGILSSDSSNTQYARRNTHNAIIDNAATLKLLSRIALAHADAGADYVAPSAMAKGQVAAIRRALDKNGYRKTKIMGYSAKFASNFYGPFRNAADSAPRFGDRRGYQLDYSGARAAMAEIKADIEEGADIVMVKPALLYLDIIRRAKEKFDTPLAAFNTSGEYAFIKYGARQGLWNETEAVKEAMASIKRAGADYIITYHGKEMARWLR